MKKDILVNRVNRLSSDYVPEDLVKVVGFETPKLDNSQKSYLDKEAYYNFLIMQFDALNDGFYIIVDSGYRSFKYQNEILNYNVLKKGAEAFRTVAYPGMSEHQTGLALDYAFFRNGKYIESFNDDAPEVKWIFENAYKYGFILRYPKDYEYITGFAYEWWHIRYVGREVSMYMKDNNIATLEEYHELKSFLRREKKLAYE